MPVCKDCRWCVDLGKDLLCALTVHSGPGMKGVRQRSRISNNACKLAIFLKNLPHITGKVLEVGSGRWNAANICLEDVGVEWVGLDPRWARKGISKPNTVDGCAEKLPFPDGEFDWVISFSAIEHFGRYKNSTEMTLAETARVLKPGGKTLVDASMGCPNTVRLFAEEHVSKFLAMFDEATWKTVVTEEWKCQDLTVLHTKRDNMWELEVLAEKR